MTWKPALQVALFVGFVASDDVAFEIATNDVAFDDAFDVAFDVSFDASFDVVFDVAVSLDVVVDVVLTVVVVVVSYSRLPRMSLGRKQTGAPSRLPSGGGLPIGLKK